MDKATVRKSFLTSWDEWTSALAEIDPDVTREPGVCGEWNIHDVVGHVQVYLRYYLSQARAAFSHVEATDDEINGGRSPMPDGTPNTLEARNAALRETTLPLTWQQLVDESAWLRERVLAFFDERTEDELDEDVGWVEFWDPDFPKPDDLKIHVRRVSEVPAAYGPMRLWRLLMPDGQDGHLSEHLDQIRSWLAKRS